MKVKSCKKSSGDLYKCSECNKVYQSKLSYYVHQRDRHSGKVYQCNKCDKSYQTSRGRQTHIDTVHKGIRFKCEICEKLFPQKGNLERHLRIHTGERPFVCDFCEMRFISKAKLTFHIQSYHRPKSERKHECKSCGKRFVEKNIMLKRHECYKPTEPKIECIFCHQFLSKSYLVTHCLNHIKERPYECNLCGKEFSGNENLKLHIARTHTLEKPFKCSVCNKDFVTCGEQTAHEVTHQSLEMTGKFNCVFCGKVSRTRGKHFCHIRGHIKEKSSFCSVCQLEYSDKFTLNSKHAWKHSVKGDWKCEACGQEFVEICRLHRHIRQLHTQEKMFKCTMYLCKSRFFTAAELKVHQKKHPSLARTGNFKCVFCGHVSKIKEKHFNHLRVHINEKPAFCGLCNYETTESWWLNKHKKKHLLEGDWKCEICGMAFRERPALLCHRTVRHGITKLAPTVTDI